MLEVLTAVLSFSLMTCTNKISLKSIYIKNNNLPYCFVDLNFSARTP